MSTWAVVPGGAVFTVSSLPTLLTLTEPKVAEVLIVRAKVKLPGPAALVAVKVTLNVPAVVGVPEISPEDVFMVSPAGRAVAL